MTPLRSSPRRLAAAFAVLFMGVAGGVGAAPAASTRQTVKVWFLQGEQMTAVARPGSTAEDAIRELLRGPTAAETKQGVETYVPTGTKLRSTALRKLRVCALAKATGADLARTKIAPSAPVLLFGNVPTLLLNLQTSRCDVVVYDAPTLGTLTARAPDRYGPFVGVIRTGEQYGISLPKGSPLLGPVNKALTSLLSDGSVDGLARQWLTFDHAKARALG